MYREYDWYATKSNSNRTHFNCRLEKSQEASSHI